MSTRGASQETPPSRPPCSRSPPSGRRRGRSRRRPSRPRRRPAARTAASPRPAAALLDEVEGELPSFPRLLSSSRTSRPLMIAPTGEMMSWQTRLHSSAARSSASSSTCSVMILRSCGRRIAAPAHRRPGYTGPSAGANCGRGRVRRLPRSAPNFAHIRQADSRRQRPQEPGRSSHGPRSYRLRTACRRRGTAATTQDGTLRPPKRPPHARRVPPTILFVRRAGHGGHGFFGGVPRARQRWSSGRCASYGLPNGYILGQEGSGAFIAGLRYGEGTLYTRNAGQHMVYWQGPSIGADIGANGDRVMMLVYNLPSVEAIYDRFVGVNGSAYVVAGFGMTVLSRRNLRRADRVGRRGAARRQFRLPEIHHAADLEPVLTARHHRISRGCRNVAGGAGFRVNIGLARPALALPQKSRRPPGKPARVEQRPLI